MEEEWLDKKNEEEQLDARTGGIEDRRGRSDMEEESMDKKKEEEQHRARMKKQQQHRSKVENFVCGTQCTPEPKLRGAL